MKIKTNYFCVILICITSLVSCRSIDSPELDQQSSKDAECVQNYDPEVDYFPDKSTVDIALGFQVEYYKSYKVVTVKQPWEDAKQNLKYVLVQCGTPEPTEYPDATIVEIPVHRVIAMSTTYLPHIEKLGQFDSLVGVGDRRLIYSEFIRSQIEAGIIQEVGDLQQDNEKVLGLNPDVILSYRLEDSDSSGLELLESLGMNIVLDAAHLEASPLGRAEWLKFTALLFNEEAKANEEFTAIAQRYEALKKVVENVSEKPVVLSGSPFQGVWYVPGGQGFFAQLFRDANVDYPWQATTQRLSLPLDFEGVLEVAKDADFWVNVNQDWQNQEDILKEDPRYELFDATLSGEVYAANARRAVDGGNDFWESGVTNPDIVLADLIKIFHPELLPDHELYYYRQLQ